VYPILLFLDCPVLISPSFYSNVCLSCILCTQYYQCFPKGQSRQNNPETLVILGTKDTGQINVRVNRRGNQDSPILPVFLYCLVLIAPSGYSNIYLSCVLCTQCYCFWIVLDWLPLRCYSNVCLSCVLCTQYYQCFCIVKTRQYRNTGNIGHTRYRTNRR
jgi:hypothetical protein